MYSNYTSGTNVDQGVKGSLDLQAIVGIVAGSRACIYHSSGVHDDTSILPPQKVLLVLVILAMLSVAYCPLPVGDISHTGDTELSAIEEANPRELESTTENPPPCIAPPPPYHDGNQHPLNPLAPAYLP